MANSKNESTSFLDLSRRLCENEKAHNETYDKLGSSILGVVGATVDYHITGSEEARVTFSEKLKDMIESFSNLLFGRNSTQVERDRSR